MLDKYYNQAPPTVIVSAVFVFALLLLSRESSMMDDLPAFLPLNGNYFHIELSGDVALPGVYQINDGMAHADVIKLTRVMAPAGLLLSAAWKVPFQDGEKIEVIKKEPHNKVFRRGWMSANHRVSMGVPLHPDRMSSADWQYLPGIGEVLAGRIELDRQKNGDFVRLEGLDRVQGVGMKSIKKWRVFFSDI